MLMILRKEYQMQVVCEIKGIQTTGTNGVNNRHQTNTQQQSPVSVSEYFPDLPL